MIGPIARRALVWRAFADDDVVVLAEHDHTLHRLEGIAAAVWSIADGRSGEEIADELAGGDAALASTLRPVVGEVAEALRSLGLVEGSKIVADVADASPPEPPGSTVELDCTVVLAGRRAAIVLGDTPDPIPETADLSHGRWLLDTGSGRIVGPGGDAEVVAVVASGTALEPRPATAVLVTPTIPTQERWISFLAALARRGAVSSWPPDGLERVLRPEL